MPSKPEVVARRARWEKWFWVVNLPVAVVLWWLAYVRHVAAVEGVMILYLALVSVHALVKTCATEEQAAEARGSESDSDG